MRAAHTTHTRDAALRQLQRMNRWLIAGSVVLTGVLADVAASAFHGKTLSGKTARAGRPAGGSSSSHTTTGVLRAPEQPPQSGSPSEPAQESAPSEPSQEAAPQQESAPSQESAPAQEAPSGEAAPEQSAPAQEAAPEESGPVVSGGS